MCESTTGLGIVFIVLGGLGVGAFMRNIKVGSIVGGLGAVVVVLGIFGAGC